MKRIIAALLTISICFMSPLVAKSATVDEKSINAKSVILMDIDSSTVLYKQNEYEHLSPASVTKIMSILLVLEAIDNGKLKLIDTVKASKNAVSMGGSQIWLEQGESMSVDDMLKAVVIASANDACTALGEKVAGSSSGFVDMMNNRAKKLGLKNTNFENCTGLDDTTTNHYSCAYDLAKISCEVMKHKKILDYSTTWLDSLRNGEVELNNTNKLVNSFEGITGLKTGTTSNAGFCVSATASRNGLNLVAVVLGSDTSEHRFDTAAYLLEWGFANYENIKPNIDKSKIKDVKVIRGVKKSIKPVCTNSEKVLVEKGEHKFTYKYNIDTTVNAPVKKGQSLGQIKIMSNNKCVQTIDLVSNEDIKKTTYSTIFRHLLTKI